VQKTSKFIKLFKSEICSARQDVRAPENYHERNYSNNSVFFYALFAENNEFYACARVCAHP